MNVVVKVVQVSRTETAADVKIHAQDGVEISDFIDKVWKAYVLMELLTHENRNQGFPTISVYILQKVTGKL